MVPRPDPRRSTAFLGGVVCVVVGEREDVERWWIGGRKGVKGRRGFGRHFYGVGLGEMGVG